MPELSDFSVYSALLPVLVVFIFLKKIKKRPVWVICIYSIYSFINDQLIIYRIAHDLPTKILLYYFTLIEYLLFAIIVFQLLRSRIAKKALIIISVIFSVFCAYWISLGNFTRFDSLQTSIECILIMVFCLIYLYEQLTKPQIEFIYNNYQFWVIISLLIYLAGSFFLFAYAADLPKAESDHYWPILYVCSIIKNILFAVAIYISTRQVDDEEHYENQF